MKHFRLTAEDEIAHVMRWQKGDRNAIVPVLKSMRGLVVIHAKRLHRKFGADMDDLMSEADAGIIESANTYDPKYGCKFYAFAIYGARWKMRRMMLRSGFHVTMPSSTAVWGAVFAGQRIKDKHDAAGVPISDEDLAASVSASVEVMNAAFAGMVYPVRLDDKDRAGRHYHDVIPAVEVEPQDDRIPKIRAALSQLTAKEEEVITARYFSGKEPLQREVAAGLGVTHQSIQQIELRAMRKLRLIMAGREPDSGQGSKPSSVMCLHCKGPNAPKPYQLFGRTHYRLGRYCSPNCYTENNRQRSRLRGQALRAEKLAAGCR